MEFCLHRGQFVGVLGEPRTVEIEARWIFTVVNILAEQPVIVSRSSIRLLLMSALIVP